MTFLEAALELLKNNRKPLHYKKLAELAVKRDLLDHVGRTPETAMQTALANAIKKGHPDLLIRVSPGVFGLRYYPPPAEASAKEEKKEEKKEKEKAGEVRAEAGAKEEKAAPSRAKRSRRGGRSRGKAAAEAPPPAELEQEAAAEAPPAPAEPSLSADAAGEEGEEAGVGDTESAHFPDNGVAAAARTAHGAIPEVQISPQAGTVPSPSGEGGLAGSFDDRLRGRRRRRRGRGRGREGGYDTGPGQQLFGAAPAHAPLHSPSSSPSTVPHGGPSSAPSPQGAPSGDRAFADAAYEVLRSQPDGRALHIRQLTDMAISRRLIKRDSPEVWRTMRAALQQEIRDRQAQGLRPRIRFIGGAQFAIADRKVEGELLGIERALAERLDAVKKATRQAISRRIGRLSPIAYESLARVLLERLGFRGFETIKRTADALYLAVARPRGYDEVRTLISIRPGPEHGRRAVGELRAGVVARGFADGLLVAAGRLLPDAASEAAAAGPTIELWSGDQVADHLVRLGIGVQRAFAPVEYFDADFFGDLQEG